METQSPTPASSEYARRNAAAKAAGFVTVMDRVSPYPPEFFRTEHCLITRAMQPPKVYQPCTDVLPRTMSWLAAGAPMDFIDRVDARMLEAANLGEHGMARVPEACCCRIHAETGNRCPDCPQHSGE